MVRRVQVGGMVMSEWVMPGNSPERRVRREDRPESLQWIALARCLAATLDLMPQPVVLVLHAHPLRVWHANAAARSRLSASRVLLMRDGDLLPVGDAMARIVTGAIEHALALGPRHVHQVQLRAPGEAPATLQVQALDFGASADLPVTQVVMLELREKAPPEQGMQRLRDEFRLTRKEAECALGLYAMGSMEKLARCAGKSIHTVRTQLKAAMQKTATHTQAGLVAVVANLLNE